MSAPIPSQYLAPKWLATVPDSQSFWFNNGQKVSNLLDLKHALKTIPDEIFYQAVNAEANHIATWIENAIGDPDLARVLRRTTHRWGLIVNLERQLMRTLYLPQYVATRWLASTPNTFYLANGRYISSLEELKHAVSMMDDFTFEQHLQRVPNDFVNWANDALGDYLFAELADTVHNRTQFLIVLTDHLSMLHEAAKDE